MSYLNTFLQSRGYENSWRPAFMNVSATTLRAVMSSGKKGNPTTHLEELTIDRVILPSASGQHTIRQAIGLEGSAIQVFETTIRTQAHTDNSVEVNQLPDIIEGDKLVVDSITYHVHFASKVTTPSFGDMLQVYMTEDKRA